MLAGIVFTAVWTLYFVMDWMQWKNLQKRLKDLQDKQLERDVEIMRLQMSVKALGEFLKSRFPK